MPLVYACIAPHGGEIIPQLAKSKTEANLFAKTRKSMFELARQLEKAQPETIVIASPHNLRLWKRIGIVFSENSTGFLESESKEQPRVRVSAKCDVRLAREIYSRALGNKLPVVGANYGSFEGTASDLPMDWGTVIPLWFFLDRKAKRRIVIVTPSREIPLVQNFAFGRVIGEISIELKDKRVAFVASADQAHAHKKSGPYGFHASAKIYDQLVVRAIEKNELKSLLRVDPRFVEDAKPDSLWQIAMLAGCLSRLDTNSRMVSYEVPTYYGMVCADFVPV